MARYKIVVADNFHYQEEDHNTEHGTTESYENAVAACRALVDRSLARLYKPGMTAAELYDHYTSFGDDPFVVALGGAPMGEKFSAWTYAEERCAAICG
jgi:hypothetical protein